MSGPGAIAAATAALRDLLGDAVAGVAGAAVTTARPDAIPLASEAAGLNVFLYACTPDDAVRRAGPPTPGGPPLEVARVAVQLDFVVTAYGDEAALEPERLLGAAMAQLAATPVLTSEAAPAEASWRSSVPPRAPDEAVTLWSQLSSAPYRLSVLVRVSGVALDAAVAPAPVTPVLPVVPVDPGPD